MTIVKMKGNSSVNSVNINSNMKGKNSVAAASEASSTSSTTSSISSTSTISSQLSTKQSNSKRSPTVIKTDLRPEVYA